VPDQSEPTTLEGDDLGTPYLRFERQGSLAVVTVDRPDSRNALTSSMYFGIRHAVDVVNGDAGLAGLVITGTGDVFIPGGELRGNEPDRWFDFERLLGNDVVPFETIRRSPKPVVSAVNGLCQGGGLLIAMLSDVAVVSDRATFRVPELFRGIADTFYAAVLPAHVGAARARDLMFTGRKLTADEAERWGLVTRVVPHDDLLEEASGILVQICRTAPKARYGIKRLVNANYGNIDRMTFDESIAGDEFREGAAAFAEKREPAWVPDDFTTGGRL